ncbi:hypothetical protein T484DRAFT_1913919, partial [Baffinella frigidus]
MAGEEGEVREEGEDGEKKKMINCFSLKWNQLGWAPEQEEIELRAQHAEDRDEWVAFITDIYIVDPIHIYVHMWPPEQEEIELRAQHAEDRDEWVAFIKMITERFPPLLPLPDGSEKVKFQGNARLRAGTSILNSWHGVDCFLYCLSVAQVCDADGVFAGDSKVPEAFAMFQIMPEGKLQDALDMCDVVEKRAEEQARSIADTIVKHFNWKGLGISLVVDQWGFSKKLLEFETDTLVWDANEDGAAKNWEEIMKVCLAASVEELKYQKEKDGGGKGRNMMIVEDGDGDAPQFSRQGSQASKASPGASAQPSAASPHPPVEVDPLDALLTPRSDGGAGGVRSKMMKLKSGDTATGNPEEPAAGGAEGGGEGGAG